MPFTVHPTTYAAACDAVAGWHRHHRPPQGHMASFALYDLGAGAPRLCGVVMVGRPVNPTLQSRGWLEVIRLATDGTPNACSALYGAAVRWLRGVNRVLTGAGGEPFAGLVTYILTNEGGASLRAANWTEDVLPRNSSARAGRTWKRPGSDRISGVSGAKRRFSFRLNNNHNGE